ncbi:MAG: MMPL family transporter, partial [Phycisphaeraceae bacterium]
GVAPPVSVAMLLPDPADAAARRARIASLEAPRILADFRAAIDQSIFDPEVYDDYHAFLARLLRPDPPPGVALLAESPDVADMLLPRDAFAGGDAAAARALTMVRFDREFAGPAERREAIRQVEAALAPVSGATVTGMDVVAEEVRGTIQAELPVLLSVAAAVVVMWLLVVFRRPSRVLLTMIPPACCLAAVAVVMQVAGTRWNPVNLLALPLLMGIGVDDGIFLISVASRHRERGAALVEPLTASCHAITMTTMTTLLAFGSLWLASTPAIQSLGLVLVVGMIACWFASLFMLTPLLLVEHRRRERSSA